MRFGILGPFEATDDEGRQLVLGAPKQRAVLAILLLRADEVVSSERLIEELWSGAPPATAAKSLKVHVSRLRTGLSDGGPNRNERIMTAIGGYRLRVADGLAIDFVVLPDRAQLGEIVQRVRDGRLRTNIWQRRDPRRCRCSLQPRPSGSAGRRSSAFVREPPKRQ